jgi:hypothetical protein
LNLRRDQEEKLKTIESLETELYKTQGDYQQSEEATLTASKENRSLKRQLALLEGGTSSALSELAREREEAVDSNNELKKRLDAAQKKIRAQEDDSARVHDLWARDKDNWDDERRKLERKVHVAEGRLKVVLEEVAAYQASHQQPQSEAEEAPRDSTHNDAASVRTMSMTNSIRFSTLSGPNGYGGSKLTNGISLADELDFDETDEEMQTDDGGRESVLSQRHNRNQSRDSVFVKTHRRNQSHESLMRPGSVARGRLLANQAVLHGREGGIQEDDESVPTKKVEYVDTGIQFSPPPSPKVAPVETVPIVEPLPAIEMNGMAKIVKQVEPEVQHREWEIEANQRRKRVHANPPSLTIEPPSTNPMVSAASQTLEDPLSPPRTPVSPTRAPPPPPVPTTRVTTSTSTQTELPSPSLASPRRAPPPPPISVPSIQIHPPTSTPATPREALLPQHFRDAACQVSMQSPIPTRSISVQTEEIRVDKRIKLLPPHLQPASISSKPPSPEPLEENKRFSPIPGNLPPRNPRRMMSSPRQSYEQEIPSSPPSFPKDVTHDAYPGNNDDGPLTKEKGSIRRPHRVSSLFAGFENASSDDNEDFGDGDMSDSDYRTALSAPRPHGNTTRPSKRITSAPTPVPEDNELEEMPTSPLERNMSPLASPMNNDEYGSTEVIGVPQRASVKSIRQMDKPLTLVTTSKPNAMRRAALIQSGVAAHQGRSRSPSLPDVKEPPFPIPTRASSRRPSASASAPSDGNRSPTWGRGPGRHYRSNSIRKVRSAAALPRGGRAGRRHGSRSPPPMSPSTEAPESPKLPPPMPNNDVTTPRYMRETGSSRYRSQHRHQPSSTTAHTTNTTNTGEASVGSSNKATSVVDAIAQTMVGEWMFKYVRRRKSFGVAESNGMDGDGVNGVRHKRWVWLAPYERAVMWSSKQPTSGSALMGKTGRKRKAPSLLISIPQMLILLVTIQSVLDVKDENPPPKGTPSIFNRSILILTPSRALKFTATSAERHYVWLNALSFLAHSSQAVPEIVQAANPIVQPAIPDFEPPRQGSRLRRNPIRDSIRVAKGKTASARSGPTSAHSNSQYAVTEQSIREQDSFTSSRHAPSADPPIVPRFIDRGERGVGGPPLTHTRKRSNTGSRIPPPLSFRGFSGPASAGHAPTSSTAGMSVGTNGSSDIYNSQPPSSISGYTGVSGRSSVRTSDASNRPGAVVNNFFDAVGTMRMEAFISPMALSRFDDDPNEQDEMDMVGMHRRRSKERRRRSRNRDSYYSSKGRPSDDLYGGSKTAGEEDYGHFDPHTFGGHDPFRGF